MKLAIKLSLFISLTVLFALPAQAQLQIFAPELLATVHGQDALVRVLDNAAFRSHVASLFGPERWTQFTKMNTGEFAQAIRDELDSSSERTRLAARTLVRETGRQYFAYGADLQKAGHLPATWQDYDLAEAKERDRIRRKRNASKSGAIATHSVTANDIARARPRAGAFAVQKAADGSVASAASKPILPEADRAKLQQDIGMAAISAALTGEVPAPSSTGLSATAVANLRRAGGHYPPDVSGSMGSLPPAALTGKVRDLLPQPRLTQIGYDPLRGYYEISGSVGTTPPRKTWARPIEPETEMWEALVAHTKLPPPNWNLDAFFNSASAPVNHIVVAYGNMNSDEAAKTAARVAVMSIGLSASAVIPDDDILLAERMLVSHGAIEDLNRLNELRLEFLSRPSEPFTEAETSEDSELSSKVTQHRARLMQFAADLEILNPKKEPRSTLEGEDREILFEQNNGDDYRIPVLFRTNYRGDIQNLQNLADSNSVSSMWGDFRRRLNELGYKAKTVEVPGFPNLVPGGHGYPAIRGHKPRRE